MLPEAIALGFGSAASLGFRHAFDLDHIAALMDIRAANPISRKSMLNSFCYAIGHALMIFLIGLCIIFLRFQFPQWITDISQKVVGLTLLILSLLVLRTVFSKGFEDLSSISLRTRLFHIFRCKEQSHDTEDTRQELNGFGGPASIIVGMSHGLGVESPSQIVALSAVAAASNDSLFALCLLLTFTVAMIIVNLLLAFLISRGFAFANFKGVYVFLGVISILFSTWLGVIMLLY